MRDIVIGYDGSERGQDAIALGRSLAELLGADADGEPPDVEVALVFPDGAVGASGERTLDGDHRRGADRILDGARQAWPELGPGAFHVVQAGSVSAGLHRLAQERDADVLVVGASHRTAAGRVFPGSATEQTLHGSPCAVLVAPPGYAAAARPLRRVGFAYDGSPEARTALEAVRRLAGRRDDVTVVELDRRDGDPVRELVDASAGLDLLVLGSRGRGPLRRLLLGSVSAHVVRHAACPLLLLPHGADAPAADAAAPEHAGAGA